MALSSLLEIRFKLMEACIALECSNYVRSVFSDESREDFKHQSHLPSASTQHPPVPRNAVVGVDSSIQNARPEVAALLQLQGADEDAQYAYTTSNTTSDGWLSLMAAYRRQNYTDVRELPQFDAQRARIWDAMFRTDVRATRNLNDSAYYDHQRELRRIQRDVFRADILEPLLQVNEGFFSDNGAPVRAYIRGVKDLPICNENDQVRWIPLPETVQGTSMLPIILSSNQGFHLSKHDMLVFGIAGKLCRKVGEVSLSKAQFLSRELGSPHLAMNEWEDKELGFITTYDVGRMAMDFVGDRRLEGLYGVVQEPNSELFGLASGRPFQSFLTEFHRDREVYIKKSAVISKMDCITPCFFENHSHEWEHNSVKMQRERRKQGLPCLTEISCNALGNSFLDVEDVDRIEEDDIRTYTSDHFDIVLVVSYKHYDSGKNQRMSTEDKNFLKDVASQVTWETRLRRIGLWLDKNRLFKLRGAGYEWLLQGIMPYGMLPVVITPSAARNPNRFWLFIEHELSITGCGAIVPRPNSDPSTDLKFCKSAFQSGSKQFAILFHRKRQTFTFLDEFGYATIEWLTRAENPGTHEEGTQKIDVSVFDVCIKILNTLSANEHGLESISRRLSGRLELEGHLNFCLRYSLIGRAFFDLSGKGEVRYREELRNWSPLHGVMMVEYDWISGDLGQVTHFRWVVLAENESSKECVVVLEAHLAGARQEDALLCTIVRLLEAAKNRRNVVLSVKAETFQLSKLRSLRVVATALDTDWKCGSGKGI